MTLTSPASVDTDVKQRRLDAMKVDLGIAFKECGPRFLNPNPRIGTRFFVIANESTVLDKDMCTKRGTVHRSALTEEISEKELDELLRDLKAEGYQFLERFESGGGNIDGRWISYKVTYWPGNMK